MPVPGPMPVRCSTGSRPASPGTTHPRDLSEGQRLALALALVVAGKPTVLLLDEPTRGLDYPGKTRLVQVLRELAAGGTAVILATHDVELAAEVSHRTVVLADGEIVADGPTREVVTASPAFAPQIAKILAPLAVADCRAVRECGTQVRLRDDTVTLDAGRRRLAPSLDVRVSSGERLRRPRFWLAFSLAQQGTKRQHGAHFRCAVDLRDCVAAASRCRTRRSRRRRDGREGHRAARRLDCVRRCTATTRH